MTAKKFILAGLAGGIVDWILGFLLYGVILTSFYPEGESMNIVLITLGCFTFGFFISYIFNKWAHFANFAHGAKAGAILGLLLGLYTNFFHFSEKVNPDYTLFTIDVLVNIVMAAIVGGVVAWVSGKVD